MADAPPPQRRRKNSITQADIWDRPGEEHEIKLTRRQLTEVRAAFQKYDLDSSGDIDPHELRLALADLGLSDLDDAGTRDILQQFDDNHDGTMQIEEFAQLVGEIEEFKTNTRLGKERDGGTAEDDDDDNWSGPGCSGCLPGRRRGRVEPTDDPSVSRSTSSVSPSSSSSSSSSSAAASNSSPSRSQTSPNSLPRRRGSVGAAFSPFRRQTSTQQMGGPKAGDGAGAEAEAGAASSRQSYSRGSFALFNRQGSSRMSTVGAKRDAASDSAKHREQFESDSMEQLRERAREVFDAVSGQDVRELPARQFAAAIRGMVEEVSCDEMLDDVEPFAALELQEGSGASSSRTFTVDEFAGLYRRFEQWADGRQTLRGAGVALDATTLTVGAAAAKAVDGVDGVLLAASAHCLAVRSVCVQNQTLRNSTLTTLAQSYKGQLDALDLTGSRGFDDLGIKAMAAYCPELATLVVPECALTDDGLTPVLKNCPKVRKLVVSETKRIAKCLGHAHADCQVTRVPLPAAAPSAAKKGGGGLFSRSRTATSKSFAPALADASSEPAAPTYDAVESIELPVESPTAD